MMISNMIKVCMPTIRLRNVFMNFMIIVLDCIAMRCARGAAAAVAIGGREPPPGAGRGPSASALVVGLSASSLLTPRTSTPARATMGKGGEERGCANNNNNEVLSYLIRPVQARHPTVYMLLLLPSERL